MIGLPERQLQTSKTGDDSFLLFLFSFFLKKKSFFPLNKDIGAECELNTLFQLTRARSAFILQRDNHMQNVSD